MHWRLPRKRAHQLIDVFEFLQRFPARVTLAPVEPRREPDREGLREIFIRMALRIPVFEMHDVTAAERARPVSIRRLLARRLSENLLPLFLARKLVSVGVGVPSFVPHQLHKPLFRPPLDFEHHRPLQRAQPVVDEKKWHEDRRDADWNEPLIANVTWRMKHQAVRRKLVVKLLDKRFECRALESQAELGDAAFEKILVAQ